MAAIYVTELKGLGFDPHGNSVMAPEMPPLVEQMVVFGGVSTASAAFSAGTRYVMINTDSACCIAFGTAPVAVTTAHRLGANETRFYGVRNGDKVAVIASV